MRVFILSTGRCGSTTIFKACKHIKNYTSGHESLAREFGINRFNYSDYHIESDNRLSWHLGTLDKMFGNDAFYVHLIRDRDLVCNSFLKRYTNPVSIAQSFGRLIRMNVKVSDKKQVCYDYIDTVNNNIEHFLKDKDKKIQINLSSVKKDFTLFWNKIGAEGCLESSLKEFDIKHNASK